MESESEFRGVLGIKRSHQGYFLLRGATLCWSPGALGPLCFLNRQERDWKRQGAQPKGVQPEEVMSG